MPQILSIIIIGLISMMLKIQNNISIGTRWFAIDLAPNFDIKLKINKNNVYVNFALLVDKHSENCAYPMMLYIFRMTNRMIVCKQG
jgi:hypothetical protein